VIKVKGSHIAIGRCIFCADQQDAAHSQPNLAMTCPQE
jgi:hypothetical protein